MAKETFYITTPIYYPSVTQDMHILQWWTLLQDIRECKDMRCSLFDGHEHGQKIQEKAQKLVKDRN